VFEDLKLCTAHDVGRIRFVTGNSQKAVSRSTLLATIGVRGTRSISVATRPDVVNLQDGAATVCTVVRMHPAVRAGDTAIITSGGKSTIKKTMDLRRHLQRRCWLCSTTQYADTSPVIVDDGSVQHAVGADDGKFHAHSSYRPPSSPRFRWHDANDVRRRPDADTHPTRTPTPTPTPTPTGSSQRRIDQRSAKQASTDDRSTACRQRAGVNERSIATIASAHSPGGIVLGRHSRPQEFRPTCRRGRIASPSTMKAANTSPARRSARCAAMISSTAVAAAPLRRRHHPVVARRKCATRAATRRSRRAGRSARHQAELRRLRSRRLDEPAVAATVAASVEVWQHGTGGRSTDPAAFNPFDASIASTDQTNSSRSATTHLFGSASGQHQRRMGAISGRAGIVATVTGDGTIVPTIGNQAA
jgi:hypothetical protein